MQGLATSRKLAAVEDELSEAAELLDRRARRGAMLTPQQVADLCQVSIRTVWTWINRRELASIKLGRAIRISQGDLDDFIDSRRR